jgi:hypothetical protein
MDIHAQFRYNKYAISLYIVTFLWSVNIDGFWIHEGIYWTL